MYKLTKITYYNIDVAPNFVKG